MEEWGWDEIVTVFWSKLIVVSIKTDVIAVIYLFCHRLIFFFQSYFIIILLFSFTAPFKY